MFLTQVRVTEGYVSKSAHNPQLTPNVNPGV